MKNETFLHWFLDTVKLISNFLVNHKFASASSNICHTYWMAEVQWYARCHGFWQKSYASSLLRTCMYIATFRIHRRKFCYWLECTMIKSRKILAHILQCHKTQGQHQRRTGRTNSAVKRFWQHHISFVNFRNQKINILFLSFVPFFTMYFVCTTWHHWNWTQSYLSS